MRLALVAQWRYPWLACRLATGVSNVVVVVKLAVVMAVAMAAARVVGTRVVGTRVGARVLAERTRAAGDLRCLGAIRIAQIEATLVRAVGGMGGAVQGDGQGVAEAGR